MSAHDVLSAVNRFKLAMVTGPLELQEKLAQELYTRINEWSPSGSLHEEMYPSAYTRWREHLRKQPRTH